jgi:hypothetical protein
MKKNLLFLEIQLYVHIIKAIITLLIYFLLEIVLFGYNFINFNYIQILVNLIF